MRVWTVVVVNMVCVGCATAPKPYKACWESLVNHPDPEWFRDAKIGIYFHLLNVTPTAQGEIPQPVQERLLAMGKWLDLNGEAIYETWPWKIFGEGPMEIVEGHLSEHKNQDATCEEIRFTQRDNTLYATVLDWPEEGVVRIGTLAKDNPLLGDIKRIELLGHKGKLTWYQDAQTLSVRLPEQRPCEDAFVLKIKAKGI